MTAEAPSVAYLRDLGHLYGVKLNAEHCRRLCRIADQLEALLIDRASPSPAVRDRLFPVSIHSPQGTAMESEIHAHLALLGHPARDRVTDAEGVVTSVSFDLYGCVQGLLVFKRAPDGKQDDSRWYDVARLEKTGDRVMHPPARWSGVETGPEDKPVPA